ncbi:hypothetical protein V8F06_002378 [Rhypophila decipiens]
MAGGTFVLLHTALGPLRTQAFPWFYVWQRRKLISSSAFGSGGGVVVIDSHELSQTLGPQDSQTYRVVSGSGSTVPWIMAEARRRVLVCLTAGRANLLCSPGTQIHEKTCLGRTNTTVFGNQHQRRRGEQSGGGSNGNAFAYAPDVARHASSMHDPEELEDTSKRSDFQLSYRNVVFAINMHVSLTVLRRVQAGGLGTIVTAKEGACREPHAAHTVADCRYGALGVQIARAAGEDAFVGVVRRNSNESSWLLLREEEIGGSVRPKKPI